jgi:tetratricopeptide (TPR) repeat protein
MNIMAIKDYKGKNTYRSLGLRRGKAAIKQEASSITAGRICLWLGLFALVAVVNYFVFVRLGPINKQAPNEHTMKGTDKRADEFAEYFDMGCKRYQEGDLKGAIGAYTEAISLKPEEMKTYFNRGAAYSELNLYDKAINDYTTVIAMNPDSSEAYHNRGRAYLQKGLWDQAILDCSRALTLDPHMATTYQTRGMAYKGKGMLETAKRDFQKGCELGDKHGCREYKKFTKSKNQGT